MYLHIPSSKITWQWKILMLCRKYIFQWSISYCHVTLPECTMYISHLAMQPNTCLSYHVQNLQHPPFGIPIHSFRSFQATFSTHKKLHTLDPMGEMVADSQHFHVFLWSSMVEPPKQNHGGTFDGGCVVFVSPWPLHLGGILQHDFQPRWQQTWHTKIYQHDDNSNMWLRYRYCRYTLSIWVNIFQ